MPTKKGIRIIERMLRVDKVKEEDEVLQGLRPPPCRVIISKSCKVPFLDPIAWSEPAMSQFLKYQQEMKLLQDRVFAAMMGVPPCADDASSTRDEP